MEHVKNIQLEEDECIISYDVSALLTSVPVISEIKECLEQDTEPPTEQICQ